MIIRVGHKGAGLIETGNTLAAFDAALAADVDMIEFDVVPDRLGRSDGARLLLAHDAEDAERPGVLTLEQGLDHLAGDEFAEIWLDVDLKLPGYELEVVRALDARDLLDRTLISTHYVSSLRAIRQFDRTIRLGYSIPHMRRDPFERGLLAPLRPLGEAFGRAIVPGAARRALKAGVCDALMVHWKLVSARLVRVVEAQDAQLYVWTVDELGEIQRLAELGVTGVISNDPRLFAELVTD